MHRVAAEWKRGPHDRRGPFLQRRVVYAHRRGAGRAGSGRAPRERKPTGEQARPRERRPTGAGG